MNPLVYAAGYLWLWLTTMLQLPLSQPAGSRSPIPLSHDFEKDGQVAKWAPDQPQAWGEESFKLNFGDRPAALAFNPEGSLLAVSFGTEVEIYDTSSLERRHLLQGHSGIVTHVEFHPDGQRFISGSERMGRNMETLVRVWNLTQAEEERKVTHGLSDIAEKAASTATHELVLAGMWSAEDVEMETAALQQGIEETLRAAETRRDVRHDRAFVGTAAKFGSHTFSHNGSLMFYISEHNTAVALETSTLTEKFRMSHSDAIMWVGASPDGNVVGTSSWDRTVRLWDAHSGELIRTLAGSKNQNWAGSFSPDGTLIAVGSGDSIVYVWNVETGELVHHFQGFRGWVRTLSFTPDGAFLAAGSGSGTVQVFEMATGRRVQQWQVKSVHIGPVFEISDLQYSPDGTKLAFKMADGRVVVYDGEENLKWEFDSVENGMYIGSQDLVFNTASSIVVSADSDKDVRFWKL
ncbi:hypothetical protein JAAARDRAFT_416653 [Jaapia argillacea MUCL 33604]|uniref:Uncharacterized protein n=1 Tax=Jaapia argillacea MUCL 33604 TaxID=933084 RepID=A0A067PJD3_9AGAM|nr:hypothetical protein JAAARDRAFT_416653 [Jaapia argillacea MUCL 33604]